MKRIFLVILVLLLCGCTPKNPDPVNPVDPNPVTPVEPIDNEEVNEAIRNNDYSLAYTKAISANYSQQQLDDIVVLWQNYLNDKFATTNQQQDDLQHILSCKINSSEVRDNFYNFLFSNLQDGNELFFIETLFNNVQFIERDYAFVLTLLDNTMDPICDSLSKETYEIILLYLNEYFSADSRIKYNWYYERMLQKYIDLVYINGWDREWMYSGGGKSKAVKPSLMNVIEELDAELEEKVKKNEVDLQYLKNLLSRTPNREYRAQEDYLRDIVEFQINNNIILYTYQPKEDEILPIKDDTMKDYGRCRYGDEYTIFVYNNAIFVKCYGTVVGPVVTCENLNMKSFYIMHEKAYYIDNGYLYVVDLFHHSELTFKAKVDGDIIDLRCVDEILGISDDEVRYITYVVYVTSDNVAHTFAIHKNKVIKEEPFISWDEFLTK